VNLVKEAQQMLGRSASSRPATASPPPALEESRPVTPVALLTIVGDQAKVEGKFEIAESIHIECEVGGELNVGGQFVVGGKGVVSANVQTVDAIIHGVYEGNMVATGDVEITATGHVMGNIETDSLVIAKGGFFNGNVVKRSGRESKPSVYLVEDKRVGA
jgi:cytoskeletal protein CcmA (bactofilin family)